MKRLVNGALKRVGLRLVRHGKGRIESSVDMSMYDHHQRSEVPRYLNLGSGNWRHPLWHNLDKPSDWYGDAQQGKLDIAHDLMGEDSIPLESGSLRAAYCSHVVEHLADDHVKRMLREVNRCMAPGGIFRITCPDANRLHAAFLADDRHFFVMWSGKSHYGAVDTATWFLEKLASALVDGHPESNCPKVNSEQVHQLFRDLPKEKAFEHLCGMVPLDVQKANPGNHMNWFNDEKLIGFFEEAGFNEAYSSRLGQSRFPGMRDRSFFDLKYPQASLYVEAIK